MLPFLQIPYLFGVPVLPARRVIAIDPGTRFLKVVLAEHFLNRVRVLRRAIIELPPTGFNTAATQGGEDWQKLKVLLGKFGHHPVALALPQHVTISQVLDLPPVTEAEVERLVQNEAYKLAGLSQSKVAFDHAPLRPFGRHNHAFWITLSQENEISSLLDRLHLEQDNLCDATSVGNALGAAYLALFPETGATVLVNLGMRSTTVVMLLDGQVVYVTSFALGNEMFIETLAGVNRCSMEEAERLSCERDWLSDPGAKAAYGAVVDSWRQELVRLVQEWTMEHADLRIGLAAFQFVLSGGGAMQPGLVDYLNRSRGPAFALWPESGKSPGQHPAGLFAVAEGVARQALGKNPQPASLLPLELRKLWRKQRAAEIIQSVNFFLLLAVAALLAFGTWQKLTEAARKQALQAQAEAVIQCTLTAGRATRKLKEEYEYIRPLLERQQFTLDLLQTWALTQQVRSNRSFWYVLLADQQSYLTTPVGGQTNEATVTNFSGSASISSELEIAVATNRPPPRPGFIAELCIPEEGEALRRTLSQVVAALKQNPRFKNVDTVPPEQRRVLANPKAVIPERHFALFFELATNEFQASPSTITNMPVIPAKVSGRTGVAAPFVGPPAPFSRPESRP